jgi:ankyrin repeat protein
MLKMLGLGGKAPPADPLVQQLVDAAAANDVAGIDRLVSAGAAVQGMAPLKQKAPSEASPLGARMLGGSGLALPVTPLMAALASKQIEAARRLIELGADVKAQHPLLGTPVHIAAGTGAAELLRLVLDAGGDPKALNIQKQTPRQALQHLRQMIGQIANLGLLGAMFGKNLKSQFEKMMPSAQDLDACEQLLRERGG